MMSTHVFGVVSIYDHVELLPHFLEYYQRLGVREMFLSVRSEHALAPAKQFVKECGFGSVVYTPADRLDDRDKVETEEQILAAQGLDPDDYILHLDLDEFQQYPAPLSDIVTVMNLHEDWAVSGTLVDRVAADGRLPPVTPTPSLWEQFPVVVDLTANILRACTIKIMICRRRVQLYNFARHYTVGVSCQRKPVPGEYLVHHFKWLAGQDQRLEQRLRCDSLVEVYREECLRFLTYYKNAGGKFDLNDPILNARTMRAPFETTLPRLPAD